ncbi:MAG TPA: nitroreductase family protein [Verrucomicrobiae bacterium]
MIPRIAFDTLLLLSLWTVPASGAELEAIVLPPAASSGGKPVMEALRQRQTIREIKTDPIPDAVLGDLLWAAFGINRPENGHRTAPSAMNSQEIDVYVARGDGLYLYEPKPHALKPVAATDLRRRTSGQAFGTNAPVTLIFVADLSRLDKARAETRLIYANFDAGCICQNVYLFCASEGLATVVHDLDRGPLTTAMKLRPDQHIIMAQAVGWPQETRPTASSGH